MLPEIKRFADRLLHSRRVSTPQATAPSRPSLIDEVHYRCGDHWQNLLASPMDARHYVLEDWSTTVPAVFEPSETHYENEPYSRGEARNMRRRQA